MKIKIWEYPVPHCFNIPLLPDFLYLLHLKLRVLWTSLPRPSHPPAFLVLTRDLFQQAVYVPVKAVVLPSHLALSVLNMY